MDRPSHKIRFRSDFGNCIHGAALSKNSWQGYFKHQEEVLGKFKTVAQCSVVSSLKEIQLVKFWLIVN